MSKSYPSVTGTAIGYKRGVTSSTVQYGSLGYSGVTHSMRRYLLHVGYCGTKFRYAAGEVHHVSLGHHSHIYSGYTGITNLIIILVVVLFCCWFISPLLILTDLYL